MLKSFIMGWNRRKSKIEQQVIRFLGIHKEGLTLKEITDLIKNENPELLTGKTPEKSIYSIIFKRELRRKERNQKQFFIKLKEGSSTIYKLNN